MSKFGTVAGGIVIFVTALLVAYTLVVLVRGVGGVRRASTIPRLVKDRWVGALAR